MAKINKETKKSRPKVEDPRSDQRSASGQKNRKTKEQAQKPNKHEMHVHRLFVKFKPRKPNIRPPRLKPWFENKIKAARKLSKHRAARAAGRFGAPAGVALIVLISLVSLLSPKSDFEKAKEKLAKNPNDFNAHLELAEKFLENNQYEEAEEILLLAQKIPQHTTYNIQQSENILGNQANPKLQELWERKTYSDPNEVQKLVNAWEKIVKEKSDYRDGHLQLALLYYKMFEDKKAKEHLEKATELDPNYELGKKLERVIDNK